MHPNPITWFKDDLSMALVGYGCMFGGNGGLNLKDPLQVPDGPITRSRAKKIKETMQGLVQSTWAKFANFSSKTPKFKLGLKEEEPTLIHEV
jgi:hypothetical protein